MVGVEDEDAIHGARKHRVHPVFLAGHSEAHAQEIRGVVERIQWVNERLAGVILERHRGDRRHLRDQAEARDHALVRIGDVGGVVIEGGECADDAAHDCHRVGVAAEAGEKAAHLLVNHRVIGHAMVEICLLRGRRQFAVEEQITSLEEVAVFSELFDRVATIEKDAFVAIDEGDLRFTSCG